MDVKNLIYCYHKFMKNILIIDDDKTILMTYSYMLTDLNYDVKTTDKSTEGLELAINNSFDLILTDCNMPILNGIELVRELKKTKPDSNVYITSGGLDNKQLEEINNIGISGILEKPFSLSKIVALL